MKMAMRRAVFMNAGSRCAKVNIILSFMYGLKTTKVNSLFQKEELGIILQPQNGRRIRHQIRGCSACENCLGDVWLFQQNVDLKEVTLAPEETCAAMWASREKINRMIEEGTFTTWGLFRRMEELFENVKTDR